METSWRSRVRTNKPTFKWSFDCGEGSIGNLEAFRELDPLMRCDLLTDWIYELEAEHKLAGEDLMVQWEEIQAKAKKERNADS
jgi:hypothetical protein